MPSPSKFYLLSGGREPLLLLGENDAPASFDSLEKAFEAARHTTMTRAFGGVIVEWNEHGFVQAHDI